MNLKKIFNFWDFLILEIFLFFLDLFEFYKDIFFGLLGLFSKLLRLLLKVNEVTNKHQKLPKISKNSIKISVFSQSAKKKW